MPSDEVLQLLSRGVAHISLNLLSIPKALERNLAIRKMETTGHLNALPAGPRLKSGRPLGRI